MRASIWHHLTSAFLAGTCCAVLAYGGQPSFSVTISAVQEVVKSGTEVKIDISLKNTSRHELAVAKAPGESRGELSGFVVEVRDGDEKSARTTKYGRAVKGESGSVLGPFSLRTIFLPAGETLNDRVVVSNLYDLTEPGKYSIQVYRVDPKSKAVVKSNTITVTVTP